MPASCLFFCGCQRTTSIVFNCWQFLKVFVVDARYVVLCYWFFCLYCKFNFPLAFFTSWIPFYQFVKFIIFLWELLFQLPPSSIHHPFLPFSSLCSEHFNRCLHQVFFCAFHFSLLLLVSGEFNFSLRTVLLSLF